MIFNIYGSGLCYGERSRFSARVGLLQEEEAKVEMEAKGQIRYRLEYDFTTQELKITVSDFAQLVSQGRVRLKCQHLPLGSL